MTKDFAKAEERLLALAKAKKAIPTESLLEMAETKTPAIRPDTLRWAYWTLVGEGKLVRTPAGVLRTKASLESAT